MTERVQAASILHHKFIPWTEDEARMMCNGKMLNEYFEFVEEMYGDEMPKARGCDDILSMISQCLKQRKDSSPCGDSRTSIVHTAVIAGAMNPNMPPLIKQKDGNYFQFLELRNKGAIWADANGFGEYVVYKDLRTHAGTKRKYVNIPTSYTTSEPFHPHYGLLIEYVSDKLYIEPSELHFLVACLDEEIAAYHRPTLDWNLEHNSLMKKQRKNKERKGKKEVSNLNRQVNDINSYADDIAMSDTRHDEIDDGNDKEYNSESESSDESINESNEPEGPTFEPGRELSAYELKRLERIERNKAYLTKLGLDEDKSQMVKAVGVQRKKRKLQRGKVTVQRQKRDRKSKRVCNINLARYKDDDSFAGSSTDSAKL